jgi:hypothetical protein
MMKCMYYVQPRILEHPPPPSSPLLQPPPHPTIWDPALISIVTFYKIFTPIYFALVGTIYVQAHI